MGFNRRFVSRVGSDEAIGPGIFHISATSCNIISRYFAILIFQHSICFAIKGNWYVLYIQGFLFHHSTIYAN